MLLQGCETAPKRLHYLGLLLFQCIEYRSTMNVLTAPTPYFFLVKSECESLTVHVDLLPLLSLIFGINR